MIATVTITPTEVLAARQGRELLILQSDENPESGAPIYISFGGPDMTTDETPAPAGFRLDPGEQLTLDNSTPLVKQQAVFAVVATGTAALRIISH